MSNPAQNHFKIGNRQVQQQFRTYKRGEVLFRENTSGRELFVIQDGRVGVYSDTPDGRIELAIIGQGGIVGEMSLLDNRPRSATVEAIEPTNVMIISHEDFQAIMESVPVWIRSIIKIMVSRLRDANKRVDQTALRDKERGLVALLILLVTANNKGTDQRLVLDYDFAIGEAYFVCRIKKKEIQRIVEKLNRRGIIQILEKKETESQTILIKDLEVLRLYVEYLLLKSQNKHFSEISIPDGSVGILSNIAYVAQKFGQETPEGTILMKNVLVKDLACNIAEKIDAHLVDLRRWNLIDLYLDAEVNDKCILFQKKTLSRIRKIREWLPRFELEL